LIDSLRLQGIGFVAVTLHVGLDTFAPVTEDHPEEHAIHTEWCQVTPQAADVINRTRKNGKRIIAVGTTSVRTLESAARGSNAVRGANSARNARQSANLPSQGIVTPFEGPTDLFILPGYQFRAVDAMITNFHLPRSTLIMLVSAFAGRERILAAYEQAKCENYRFYSFGDAMLIL
jgi:S-adenosylmethionine:tRNA ribosyltransferase-isomerase